MKNLLRVWSLTLFILVFATAPAWAVNITSATINYASNQITIAGNELAPPVYFNGMKLTIVGTHTGKNITAQLPGGLTSGTYKLRVEGAVFDVTYGPTTPAALTGTAALLQWYTKTYAAGSGPSGIAFDGTNIWVVNRNDNTLTVLNAISGQPTSFSPVSLPSGGYPAGIAFDGVNMWVTNHNIGTVSVINASTGQAASNINPNPITGFRTPYGIAFDGTNMWVANADDTNVIVINASTGQPSLSPVSTENNPEGIASDGTNMWITNWGNDSVTVINATTGVPASFSPVTVRNNPRSIAFDGANMWVVSNSNKVSVINASTGSPASFSPVTVGDAPEGIAFDGTNMWVVNEYSRNLSVINAATGFVLKTIPLSTSSEGIAFDGANVWVTNFDNGSVTRMPAR